MGEHRKEFSPEREDGEDREDRFSQLEDARIRRQAEENKIDGKKILKSGLKSKSRLSSNIWKLTQDKD